MTHPHFKELHLSNALNGWQLISLRPRFARILHCVDFLWSSQSQCRLLGRSHGKSHRSTMENPIDRPWKSHEATIFPHHDTIFSPSFSIFFSTQRLTHRAKRPTHRETGEPREPRNARNVSRAPAEATRRREAARPVRAAAKDWWHWAKAMGGWW